MKKILLGLAAMSAVSFAAVPNYGATATAGTNVFQTGQNGKIAVTGALTSTIPVVKYVVFASTDGTTADDTLALTTFTLSTDSVKNVFEDVNPKVYVKRVNGDGNGFTNLLLSDVVEFSLERDGYMGEAAVFQNNWVQAGGKLQILPLMMLSDARIQEIVNEAVKSVSGILNANGLLYLETTNRWRAYLQPNTIHFKHTTNGVLEIVADTRGLRLNYDPLNEMENKAVDAVLAASEPSSGFSILVRLQ